MTYADRIPAPRPIPTTRQRITDARACGHTPEQHRHDDGQAADAASRDRAIRELTAANRRLAEERGRLLDIVRHKRDTISALATELGDAHDLIAEIRNNRANDDRAFARWETRQPEQQPPSSVPPHRAQDEHARGYSDAIAYLRDDERYMDWWSSTGVQLDGPVRRHLADYLETVGPDGIDVTVPAVAISGNPCCGGNGVEASCELCRP